MTIKRTLFGLISFLALALLAVVAVLITENVGRWREMAYLASSNLAREQLARASVALATERTASYLEMNGLQGGAVPRPVLRQATDQAIADVRAAVGALPNASALVGSTLEDVPRRLAALRQEADRIRSTAGPANGVAEEWFSSLVGLVNSMNSLRFNLLARERATDPETAVAFRLRSQASAMYEFLARNTALLPVMAAGNAPADAERLEAAERNGTQAEIAAELLRDQPGLIAPELRQQIEALQDRYHSLYRPAERALLRQLSAGGGAQSMVRALAPDAEALRVALESLLSDLFVTSRDRIAEMRGEAARTALSWLALLLLGGLVVAASVHVIDSRIVEPLRRLREAMLRLAEGDLDTSVPELRGNDETAAMADALRVFKSQSIRRSRLQDERLALHGRLRESYQQLRIDLEAAAAVQMTLLPPPARLNGVAFSGYFRPSHYIAGDTYDVVRRPDGRINFFQIDVAGHGAPAALISVATHHSIAQALHQRRADESLSGVAAAVNAEWPEHFPYFTMVMGEIDPAARRGALIQAGHPPPFLVARDGTVRPIGEGGLPIGILREASFDEVEFDFSPGDRLLVYSDGLIEAENPERQGFDQERLQALLEDHAGQSTADLLSTIDQALRNWRGSGTLEDDVTVLILEAESENEHAGGKARECVGSDH